MEMDFVGCRNTFERGVRNLKWEKFGGRRREELTAYVKRGGEEKGIGLSFRCRKYHFFHIHIILIPE